ncbi:tetratricopeptide repeat protein [Thermodesulfobacteriota bacterium]
MKRIICLLSVFMALSSFHAMAQEDATKLYNDGVVALEQNKLDEAIKLFTRSIELDPQDYRATTSFRWPTCFIGRAWSTVTVF